MTKTFGDDARVLRAVQNGLIASQYALGATDARPLSAAYLMTIRWSECLSGLVREGRGIDFRAIKKLSRMIAIRVNASPRCIPRATLAHPLAGAGRQYRVVPGIQHQPAAFLQVQLHDRHPID